MADIKLDLARMKHIKSDDKSTTLMHPKGHQITLSHSVLSPSNVAILKGMAGKEPQKEDFGKVIQKAEGGPVYKNPELAKKGMASLKAKHKESPELKAELAEKNKTRDAFMRNLPSKPMKVEKYAAGGYTENKAYSPMSGGSEANYAYDAGLPCLNPNCKSHGQPHPNCRCYSSAGHFAEGGEVSKLRYCAQGQPHMDGCEYAHGGRVSDRELKQQREERRDSEGSSTGTLEQFHETGKNTPIGKMQREKRVSELRNSNRPLKGLADGGNVSVGGVEVLGTGRAEPKYKPDQGRNSDHDEAWPSPSETSVGRANARPKSNESIYEPAMPPESDANGGRVGRKMYAEQEEVVSNDDSAPTDTSFGQEFGKAWKHANSKDGRPMPSGGPSPQRVETPEPEAKAEEPGQIPPADPNFNSVTGQTQGQPAPAIPDSANAPDANAQNAKQPPPQPTADSLAEEGLREGRAGNTQEAQAVGNLGMAQAPLVAQDAIQKQEIMDKFKKNYDILNGERQAHIQDIQNGYIDPNQYWTGDKNGDGSHSKIAAGIGMILGGFNPTNRPNAAIDFLKYQMDRNIDAQKTNLAQKNNLLYANLQQFKNMHDAVDMTRLMQADVVKSQLQSEALKAQGPMAKAAALKANAQLDATYQPLFMNMEVRHLMRDIGQGGSQVPGSVGTAIRGLQAWDPAKAKDYQNMYYSPFDKPGGKSIASRPIEPGDRNQILEHDKFNMAAGSLHNLIKNTGGWARMNPIQRAKANQDALVLQSIFRGNTLGTVYKSSEQPMLEQAVAGEPLALVNYFTANPKLENLMQQNNMMKNTLLDNYDLRPPPNERQAPQIKMHKGIAYKRGPNGEAIPVKQGK